MHLQKLSIFLCNYKNLIDIILHFIKARLIILCKLLKPKFNRLCYVKSSTLSTLINIFAVSKIFNQTIIQGDFQMFPRCIDQMHPDQLHL